jgi:hypothetical protein
MLGPSHLPSSGFVRLSAILAPRGPIPVSKSTWWAGVKDGRFPRPFNWARESPCGAWKIFLASSTPASERVKKTKTATDEHVQRPSAG